MLETLLNPTDTEERCGLVMKDGSIVEIRNIADDPKLGFRMDPAQLLEHIDNATGTWHTHPDADANLSGEDWNGFLAWPKLEHSIIGLQDGKIVVRKYVVREGVVVSCD